MRRSIVPVALLASVALTGCEDGPNQTFKPAPESAGTVWNNGHTPGATDNGATSDFQGQGNTTTRIDICSGQKKAAVWAEMVKKPIIPPRQAGGLDQAGGDTWAGITIEEAEKINCQSDPLGDQFGNGSLVNSWGDNSEVWAEYRVSTRKVLAMTLWPGYLGTMDFKSRDGAHSYQIAISQQVKKDGQNFILDWVGNGGKNFKPAADELYQALLATYQPGLPTEPQGVTCFDVGKCIQGSFGDVAYFYIPSLGWALWIDNQHANQPVPSIPTRLDVFPVKILPFAFALPTIKLDKEGPIGVAGTLGKATNPCTLKMGLTYQDFLANCVQVSGDASIDKNELNMLLGGLSHGAERFHFDIQGVDVNFTDQRLPADDIIHDKDLPGAMDTSTFFRVDQSTLGKIQNDRDMNGKLDLHGSGAVYREYMRIVRTQLLALAGVEDGDQSQCLYPAGWQSDPNFDPNAFAANLPAYCTGFEGFVTAAPSTGNTDVNNLGVLGARSVNPSYGLGLKLGHQKVSFCWDANGIAPGKKGAGYTQCNSGDTFQTSFAQVKAVFGKGKVTALPVEAQDVRFFFKAWFTAFAKYLTVGSQNPVPDLAAIKLNPDDLFFDSIGAGQFEIAEFVDRRFASKTQEPLDLVFVADVRNGIFNSYEFDRDIYRGESAVYTAMLEDQNDAAGQEESALLTNVFGSPVLAAGWAASSKGKSAYYCATNMDPGNCDGQTPPTDANGDPLLDEIGRPILKPYPGAFAGSQTLFTLGSAPIKILKTYQNIQSAMVRLPLHVDPYNPKSKGLPFYDTLIPWAPKQPGVGFPVALNGTLSKFVETAQLDFSGITITANVDYDFVIDPMTHQPKKDGSIQFLAVETTDFLGQVFLCQDPGTGDLLSARMYTPVAGILDWIQKHPAAVDACGLIVQYSPYNNYADYINSLNAGVRLGITQGGGYGRVVDVTLFVPGQ